MYHDVSLHAHVYLDMCSVVCGMQVHESTSVQRKKGGKKGIQTQQTTLVKYKQTLYVLYLGSGEGEFSSAELCERSDKVGSNIHRHDPLLVGILANNSMADEAFQN